MKEEVFLSERRRLGRLISGDSQRFSIFNHDSSCQNAKWPATMALFTSRFSAVVYLLPVFVILGLLLWSTDSPAFHRTPQRPLGPPVLLAIPGSGDSVLCEPTQIRRTVFPTVPRSGNHLYRILLENATGKATGSVYSDSAGIWNERTRAFEFECGILGNCSQVTREPSSSWTIVKNHFPYTYFPDIPAEECASGILMTVRHPLDNFLAWHHWGQEFLEGRNTDLVKDDRRPLGTSQRGNWSSLERMTAGWDRQISYWKGYAAWKGVPLLVVRYEDLCEPRNWKAVTDLAIDLAEHGRVPSNPAKSAAKMVTTDSERCLLSNLRTPIYRAHVTKNEVDSILALYRDRLEAFGYPSTWKEIHAVLGVPE